MTSGEPRLHLTIEDDGPGLPGESRQRALRRGARLDESKPGSGLGLSIAQRAVELHGGTLTIESVEGQGTLVAVAIPLMPQKNPAAAPA